MTSPGWHLCRRYRPARAGVNSSLCEYFCDRSGRSRGFRLQWFLQWCVVRVLDVFPRPSSAIIRMYTAYLWWIRTYCCWVYCILCFVTYQVLICSKYLILRNTLLFSYSGFISYRSRSSAFQFCWLPSLWLTILNAEDQANHNCVPRHFPLSICFSNRKTISTCAFILCFYLE